MKDVTWIILCAAVLILGLVLGYFLNKLIPALKEKDARNKAEKILRDAEIRAEQIKRMLKLMENKQFLK